MEDLTRKLAGPGIFAIAGIAVTVAGWQSEIVGYVLIAIAVVWGLLALWVRSRIAISLEASVSELPGMKRQFADGRVFEELTSVWVSVTNHRKDGEFLAEISDIQPVVRVEDEHKPPPDHLPTVDEVAWENTTKPEMLIRREKTKRLKVAEMSLEPDPLFFFFTAESATWTRGPSYGIGWRLKPVLTYVDFKLKVTNVTSGRSVAKDCRFLFDSDGKLEQFAFLD